MRKYTFMARFCRDVDGDAITREVVVPQDLVNRIIEDSKYSPRSDLTKDSNLEASALALAAQEMADIIKKKVYPTPDKPESDWGKLMSLYEAIAAYRKKVGA